MSPSSSPSKAVYVKSKVAVANGIEQTNPDEHALVASAQYRIRSTARLPSKPSWRSLPLTLLVTLVRRFAKNEYAPTLRVSPAMVLPFLLLGSEYNASQYDELYALGVTHICNLDFASRNYFEGKFVYVKLNLRDVPETDLTRHFAGVNQFCEACEALGGRVLVHCATGNALAPAFVVSYLMAKKHKSMEDAVQLVRAMRPTVHMYPSFLEQLQQSHHLPPSK